MEFVLLFALSVIVAIFFNFGSAKFTASDFGQRFAGSYLRVTLGTAIVFFFAIYLASILLSAVSREPHLPTISNPT